MTRKKIVTFLCCNTQKVFANYNEFSLCDCGKSGFDMGDGFYYRVLGTAKVEDGTMDGVQTFLNTKRIPWYVDENGFTVAMVNVNVRVVAEAYGRYILYVKGDKPVAFSTMKSALKRVRKIEKGVK